VLTSVFGIQRPSASRRVRAITRSKVGSFSGRQRLMEGCKDGAPGDFGRDFRVFRPHHVKNAISCPGDNVRRADPHHHQGQFSGKERRSSTQPPSPSETSLMTVPCATDPDRKVRSAPVNVPAAPRTKSRRLRVSLTT
jgi:hypothetical protein